MRGCPEEGIIQAYVDGELSPQAAERVAAHAAACALCAEAVSEAEDGLALLATALEPEFAAPVPSDRLRERLDAAIADLRPHNTAPARATGRNLRGWLGWLVPSFNFAPRQALGFASLVAVIAFAALFAVVVSRRNESNELLASANERETMELRAAIKSGGKQATTDKKVEIIRTVDSRPNVSRSRRASRSPRIEDAPASDAGTTAATESDSSLAEGKPLPGELNYLKTIASLTSIIETNGASALRPSLRVDYERNLALVNQAIDATRRTARSNPKNQDAAEFLYSSYQSKIDLLSTVAEQGQMVAALR